MTATDDQADPAALGPTLADLPVAVRQRVVGWVAAALPDVPVLPTPLRRVRDFAPARRARAGGVAIAAALDDDDFRARAALAVPEPAAGGEDADATGRAARAWLVRGDGWSQRLAEALTALDDDPGTVDVDRLARLEQRLEAAEKALRDARAQHRREVEELRADNARLRRSLGEERRAARAGAERQRVEVEAAQEARRRAEVDAGARARELRQVQARLSRAEEESGAVRRTARAERDEVTLRARLLLDTVVDAVGGLRRELALPSTTATPGERVERDLVSEGARDSSAAGSLGSDSPALLDQYLAMPRARLVVDGYNVTKTVWGTLPLEAQRHRLLRALAPLAARTGAETTVVFDAHQVGVRPVVAAPRGVRVAFSPEGVIADDVIRDLVAAEPTGRVVVVVTGDAALAGDVRRDGARVCAAHSLLRLLAT